METAPPLRNPLGALRPSRAASLRLPMPLWLIAAALLVGFALGGDGAEVLQRFGSGFGRSLGDFVLILLPSFTLAACLGELSLAGAWGRGLVAGAPWLGAGMACPDTAYAALAPAAGRYKLPLAFASYGGFKLLVPAGPLVVAAGLGLDSLPGLLPVGLALAVPVIAAGTLWASWQLGPVAPAAPPAPAPGPRSEGPWRAMLPFGAMGGALVLGGSGALDAWPALAFVGTAKGALIGAAMVALGLTPASRRSACLESAVRRSSGLLLLIGSASALGAMLDTAISPVTWIAAMSNPWWQLLAVFGTAALVKTVQGSSMVTFATVAPLLAPLAASAGLPPTALVFAICLGSFALILPNDSFYWLVRSDALAHQGERRALPVLALGSALQAVIGLVCLAAGLALGWL